MDRLDSAVTNFRLGMLTKVIQFAQIGLILHLLQCVTLDVIKIMLQSESWITDYVVTISFLVVFLI